MLWQADRLRVPAENWQRSNLLAWFDSGNTVPKPIDHTNHIPPRREGQSGCFGMNAFAHHYVGQGYACSLYSHPYFTLFRFRALFFNHTKFIGPAVVSDSNVLVFHGPIPPI